MNLIYETLSWVRKWLVNFNAGKTQQLVLFNRSNDAFAIDVKMSRSVLEEKLSFKTLGLTFSSKSDWGPYIISVAKTASRKIGVFILSMKSLSPERILISINLPYDLAWNVVISSGLVLLAAT